MQQDYEKLFEKAIYHLRILSSSRNSMSPDVFKALTEAEVWNLRTPEVEAMHRQAYDFLKQHTE